MRARDEQDQLTAMQSGPVFARNVIVLTLSEAANVLLPFLTIAYLSRILTPVHLGAYLFAWACIALLGTVIEWGFSWTASQDIARDRSVLSRIRTIFANVLFARLTLVVPCAVAYVAVFLTLSEWREHWVVFLAMSPCLLGAALHPGWILRGLEAFGGLAVANFIGRAFTLLSVLIFVTADDQIARAGWFTALGTLLTGFVGAIVVLRTIGGAFEPPSFKTIVDVLRQSLRVFISSQATNVSTNFAVFLVGFTGGPYVAGQFGIAYKCLTVGKIMIGAFLQVGMPRVAAFASNPSFAREFIARLVLILGPLGILGSASVILLADPIIRVLFGPGHDYAAHILQILAPIGAMFCFSGCFAGLYMFNFNHRDAWSRMLHITACIFLLAVFVLSMVLPTEQAVAIAMIISEGYILATSTFIFIKR